MRTVQGQRPWSMVSWWGATGDLGRYWGTPGEERVSYQVLKIFKDVSEPNWNFRELSTAFQLSVTKASFINVFAHNFDELWTSDGQSALPKPPGNELGRSVDRSWLTWCPGGVLSFTLDFRPSVWLSFLVLQSGCVWKSCTPLYPMVLLIRQSLWKMASYHWED